MRKILFVLSSLALFCNSAMALSCNDTNFDMVADELEYQGITKKAIVNGKMIAVFSSYGGKVCENGRDYGLIVGKHYDYTLSCAKPKDVQFSPKGNVVNVTFKEGNTKIRYSLKNGKLSCNRV
jgi:hypothetical protein